MTEISFSGKNVIITGGTGGIGLPVAEGVVSGGGRAIIIVHRRPERIAPLVEKYGADKVSAVCIDLESSEAIRAGYTKIIEEYEHIDVLINVAGVISSNPFEEISQQEWEHTLAVNLTAVFAGIQSVFGHMKQRGAGRIVNVSSVAGKIGGGLLGTAAYAASKAGVNALTKAVAKEGGPFNVCCNAVCPSLTYTQMTSSMGEEKLNRILSSIPLRRGAQPQEIANVILFYASELASFCNGEITDADGGIVLDG